MIVLGDGQAVARIAGDRGGDGPPQREAVGRARELDPGITDEVRRPVGIQIDTCHVIGTGEDIEEEDIINGVGRGAKEWV